MSGPATRWSQAGLWRSMSIDTLITSLIDFPETLHGAFLIDQAAPAVCYHPYGQIIGNFWSIRPRSSKV